MIRVLVGCESSGQVREAFRRRGFDAWSCDLRKSADGSPFHVRGDVREVARNEYWDLFIAHPPCTHLAASGARWFHEKRDEQHLALSLVRNLMDAPVGRIAIENPIGLINTRIGPPTQIIQPYQFGENASKATCLWLKNLPRLRPTERVRGRIVNGLERFANQTDSGQNRLAPSPWRATQRSRTYYGVAEAMAEQWGSLFDLTDEDRRLMPENRAQELLDQLNPLIFGRDSPLQLAYVDYEDLREQDINANVMPTGMFNALVANVRKHQHLESIPLCATRAETPDVIEIVSGHHRIRAARQAGVRGGIVLLYRGLTNSEIRAKQLAHNSIEGSSDPEVVKVLFEQIDEIDLRMESYIDPSIFDTLPKAVQFEMVDIDPLAEARTVTVVFLPTQASDFGRAAEFLAEDPDEVYLAHREAFDGFRDAVHRVREELEIVAYPTALAAMARLALERLAQIKAERAEILTNSRAQGIDPVFPDVPVRLDDDLVEFLEA